MKIRKANEKDIREAIKIAKSLPKWFTKKAIQNMKIDFKINNLVVAVDKKVVGFLCYSSNEGILRIIWLAVDKNEQRKGVGNMLLKWLEKNAKKLNSKTLEVETLTDKDNYEPYKLTRNFYYKNGFEKLYELPRRKKDWDIQILLEKKLK